MFSISELGLAIFHFSRNSVYGIITALIVEAGNGVFVKTSVAAHCGCEICLNLYKKKLKNYS